MTMFDSVLIIADIEGSSGCWSYRASAFKTHEWVAACVDMTRDVAAVVHVLLDNGVQRVIVKDFHRTGFNLLPEMIDSRARVVQGYKVGPVPGIGDPGSAEAVIFLGMHAASGSNGFMAHTLTSRIRRRLTECGPFFFPAVRLPATRHGTPFQVFTRIRSTSRSVGKSLLSSPGAKGLPGRQLQRFTTPKPSRSNPRGLFTPRSL
jgi:hypothetical protein